MFGGQDRLILLGRLAAGVAAMCAVAWIAALAKELSAPGYGGEALDVDFAVFWGAAKLALTEGPLAPFDLDRLNAARALPDGVETFPMLWLYPPGWLSVILPLGLLSFFWAWLVFCAVSICAFGAATFRASRAIPGAWLLMLAAPAVLITLALGQTALIFAALLALAIEAMRNDRPVLAGLAIAAMTLKPQLGLAIPVALLAGGHWRVILWATAGTAAILAASLVWPGADYWPAFFAAMTDASDRIRESRLPQMMTSGYGTGVALGFARDTALIAQGALSLAAAAGLGWLWASRAPFDLKAAGLAFAVLLITPYAIYYEMVFAVLGCLYLARAGSLANRARAGLALMIWLTPIIGIAVVVLISPGPGFFFAAPLVIAAFVLVLSDAARRAVLT